MEKELNSQKGNFRAAILDDLSKKRKKSILIIFLIVLGVLIIGLGFGLLFNYLKSPEVQLKLGAEIENIALSADGQNLLIKLSGGSNDRKVVGMKFSFKDAEGNECVYETNEGIGEIFIPYERSFWDIFRKPKFEGNYSYIINKDDIDCISDWTNVREIDVSAEIETDEGEVIESPVLDTETEIEVEPPRRIIGGGGGPLPPPITCDAAWIDTSIFRCSADGMREITQTRDTCNSVNEQLVNRSCSNGFYCYEGAGANLAEYCVNNSQTCSDSDGTDYSMYGNVTLDDIQFSFDECSNPDNVTEFYCSYNGTDFEIKNISYECGFGCESGGCILPECTHVDNCTANNLLAIARCDNPTPFDGVPTTWDLAPANNSECGLDNKCTFPTQDVISSCVFGSCGASCDLTNLCADTFCGTDGCKDRDSGGVANDYVDYPDDVLNLCLGDCGCESNVCGAPVITYDDLFNCGAEPLLYFSPDIINVNVGDLVVFNLAVNNVNDLYGFQFDINYDDAALNYTGITEGNFLISDGELTYDVGPLSTGSGLINDYAVTRFNTSVGISGFGNLAQIQFTALASGSVSVSFSNNKFLDSNVAQITHTTLTGTVNIV